VPCRLPAYNFRHTVMPEVTELREDLDTLLEIAADASNQEVRRDMAVAYDSLSETRKHLGDSNAAVAYHAEAVRLRRTFGQ